MRTKTFGAISIDRVEENGRFLFAPPWLYRDINASFVERYKAELGPGLIDQETNAFILSFHSYLIRAGALTILVDTCNGNCKPRPGLPWQNQLTADTYLTNLKRLGLQPEDINIVLCTHLHGDHVGWNTSLVNGRWMPTFPNARYVMSRQDYDYFEPLSHARNGEPPKHLAFPDSILPVADAGLVDFIDVERTPRVPLTDGVTIHAAPGHTPGQVMIEVEGTSDRAFVTGDIIHHPIQFLAPDLVNPGDVDPVRARKFRDGLIAEIANRGGLLLPGHFPDPSAGRIYDRPCGYRFEFDPD
jgi:glyoxylase-like metal-dependent hydrolase (beta-lactamase superfamily II)